MLYEVITGPPGLRASSTKRPAILFSRRPRALETASSTLFVGRLRAVRNSRNDHRRTYRTMRDVTLFMHNFAELAPHLTAADFCDEYRVRSAVDLRSFLAGMTAPHPIWLRTLFALRTPVAAALGSRSALAFPTVAPREKSSAGFKDGSNVARGHLATVQSLLIPAARRQNPG